jgi:hypothetical protein
MQATLVLRRPGKEWTPAGTPKVGLTPGLEIGNFPPHEIDNAHPKGKPMRRNGRDERRRRVLSEEHRSDQQFEEPTVRGDRDNPYQESARSDLQPKIVDLVPRRAFVVWLILLIQLNVVAALQSLHWAVFESAVAADRQWLRFFDMTRTGSPTSWLMAMLFAAAAVFSGILFSVRRHRRDDFKGRYRVWGWMSALLLLVGANAVTGLDRLAGEGMVRLSSRLGPIDRLGWSALEWSIVLIGLAVVSVTIRLWFDFRESRGTIGLVTVSLIAFSCAGACRLGWLPHGPVDSDWMAVSFNLLGANWLFLSFLVFSRFVVLEASGHLVGRTRRSPRPATTAEITTEEEQLVQPHTQGPAHAAKEESTAKTRGGPLQGRWNSAHRRDERPRSSNSEGTVVENESTVKSATVGIQRDSIRQPGVPAGADAYDLSEEELARMSKSERRRYRKQQRKQHRHAA